MKSLRTWLVVGIAMAGLLGIAAGLIILGRNSRNGEPVSTSYEPSGTSAFRELLNRNGYRTAVTHSVRPGLDRHDLLVVFDRAFDPESEAIRLFSEGDVVTKDAISKHLASGGRVLLVLVARDFAGASKSAKANTAVHPDGNTAIQIPISLGGLDQDPGTVIYRYIENEFNSASATIWKDPSDLDFATVFKVGPGRLLIVRDGLFATNRFLDQRQNARVALGLVHSLADRGTNVMFDEAGISDPVEPGLLETIGPWAEAVWFQILFLFVVIVYSLGKRFGLPSLATAGQRGTRELLDAVAGTFRRGKMGAVALQIAVSEADARLRKELQLAPDIPPKDVIDRLPPTLQRALGEARAAGGMQVPVSEARRLASRLDTELEAFLGPRSRIGRGSRPFSLRS